MTDISADEKKQAKREKKYNYHNTHFKYKNIPFSTTSDSDMRMLEHLAKQPNAAAYMKGAIRMRMDAEKSGIRFALDAMTLPELAELLKKVTEEIGRRAIG